LRLIGWRREDKERVEGGGKVGVEGGKVTQEMRSRTVG